MNDAHFHLIVNHFPIITPLIGFFVMVGGLVFRSEIVKRSAYLIFIIGGLLAIVAFATGDGAEEVLESLGGIDEKVIKAHEEKAETLAILSYILGALSIIGLWANWKQKPFSNLFGITTLVFCAVVLLFAKQTGTTGGEIRHTEIRMKNEPKSKTEL
jgi:uncharacterized membrane protein